MLRVELCQALDDLLVADRDRAGQRPMRHMLGLTAVDEDVARLDVIDDLELGHGLHRAGQLQRLDHSPRGVNDEQTRLARQRPRAPGHRIAPRETLDQPAVVRHDSSFL